MNFASVPIIVVCCYLLGEIYKAIFSKRQQAYKLIPVVLSLTGGLLAILIYFTNPQIIPCDNAWEALGIGIVSGSSATGANQIIKQLFNNENTNK